MGDQEAPTNKATGEGNKENIDPNNPQGQEDVVRKQKPKTCSEHVKDLCSVSSINC